MNKKEKVDCPRCGGDGKVMPQFNSLDDLYEFIKNQPKGDWSPGWFYNEAGDQIEIYWENRPTTAIHKDGGIILHVDSDDRSKVCGVTIVNIIGRLVLNACQEQRCKPRPIEPLKCPICGTKPPKPNSHMGDLLYSKDPIECHNCGITYNKREEGEQGGKKEDAR